MAPSKRSNRYLAWQHPCPNTNGPHMSNPCGCGAYDRSQPYAQIPRRRTNDPSDREVIDLCSDEDDDGDEHINAPEAGTDFGPAQYGHTAYAFPQSNLGRQPTGSANPGRFISTKLKQRHRTTAQYPKHLQIGEAAPSEDTEASKYKRTHLHSPKQASSARTSAIVRDAAYRRTDQRPSANDPPPAALNNFTLYST